MHFDNGRIPSNTARKQGKLYGAIGTRLLPSNLRKLLLEEVPSEVESFQFSGSTSAACPKKAVAKATLTGLVESMGAFGCTYSWDCAVSRGMMDASPQVCRCRDISQHSSQVNSMALASSVIDIVGADVSSRESSVGLGQPASFLVRKSCSSSGSPNVSNAR